MFNLQNIFVNTVFHSATLHYIFHDFIIFFVEKEKDMLRSLFHFFRKGGSEVEEGKEVEREVKFGGIQGK